MREAMWQVAEDIAVDLVEFETDVNEVHKLATYARLHSNGSELFALLDTMLREGQYVVRTGKTLGYYRDIQDVFDEHLNSYRKDTGARGQELAETLGWIVRLMRYYKTDDGAAELLEREQIRADRQDSVGSQATVAEPTENRSSPPPRPIAPPPKRIETQREWVTMIEMGKAGKARVKTEQGEEVPCTNIAPYPQANVGDRFRADVTRENGTAVKALFKGWR